MSNLTNVVDSTKLIQFNNNIRWIIIAVLSSKMRESHLGMYKT